ncbi:MAG: hypothetical protein HYT93_05075 [Parcubacteria group bacterium]|nr:hypothetical protein [Parcubacteria group bacterium]
MQHDAEAHWSSDQVLLDIHENNLVVHAVIGYIVREFPKEDKYFLTFRIHLKDPAHKDKILEEACFKLHFETWENLEFWISNIPSFITPLLFVKDEEMLLDNAQKIKKQQDMRKIADCLVSQLPIIREGVEYARFIPDREPGDQQKLH